VFLYCASDTFILAWCQLCESLGTGVEVEKVEGEAKVGSNQGATNIVNHKFLAPFLWPVTKSSTFCTAVAS
jgi:hypothetical protein